MVYEKMVHGLCYTFMVYEKNSSMKKGYIYICACL